MATGNNRRTVRIVNSHHSFESIRDAENWIRKATGMGPVWQPGAALKKALDRNLPFGGFVCEYADDRDPGRDPQDDARLFALVKDHLGMGNSSDWYEVNWTAFSKAPGGSTLLNANGNSVLKVLRKQLPDVQWVEWKFKAVPRGFWETLDNRMAYVTWLAKKCKVEVYDIKTAHFKAHRGYGLLTKYYAGSPAQAIAEYADWLDG